MKSNLKVATAPQMIRITCILLFLMSAGVSVSPANAEKLKLENKRVY
ncbi:hypothetical protein [Lysinibacillus sp. RS5]